METKNIKLLSEYDGQKAGTVCEVDTATADVLINGKIAKEYSPADEAEAKAIKDAADKQTKDMTDQIKAVLIEQLKDVKSGSNIHLNVQVDPQGEDKPFKSMHAQLSAIKAHATGEANEEIHNRLKAASGSNEMVDSEGGFLVQQDMTNELMTRTMETAVLASRVASQEVAGNGLKWNELDDYNRTDGNHPTNVYWTAEAATKTKSTPTFNRREMQLEKLAGLYYSTDELLEDAPGLSGQVSSWFSNEFGWQLDECIYDGNGAGKPQGFMQSNALVTVAKESGQTADTIVAENIVKMFARMPSRHQGGAVWLINQDAWPQLPLMTIGETPVYMPPTGLIDAPAGLLMGKPVVMVEQAATVGDLGDIAYVNLSEYLMIRKGGIKADSSIHVRFINDETAFRFVLRTNGQTKWSKALTPQNGSNTLSPFVTLAARA